ncbi:G/T mismatches repair enzyme [uncultured archaeon]|nr:G/T mismatches repair enzyme [uncultured archaeon]
MPLSIWHGKMDKQGIMECIRVLEELYGVVRAEKIDPVDLLIQTILSQNTSDRNSLRAFANLKRAFPGHEELLAAPVEEIADQIREGGLADIKAPRIKEALARIKQDRGSVTLAFLAKCGREKGLEYLQSLPGVGPKTASVVLLFAFGLPLMPVDTHVFRVSRRLGLIPEDATQKKAQEILEEWVPPEKYLSMHLNLIRHGRLICRARGARHEECPLRHICDCYLRATSLK